MSSGALDPAAAEEHAPCNCVAWSIEALSRVHIRLATIPNIGVNDWFRHPGAYSRGVVNVRDVDNCRVMLHEFVHHMQWLKRGDAVSAQEWQARELQAAMITMLAESEMQGCH